MKLGIAVDRVSILSSFILGSGYSIHISYNGFTIPSWQEKRGFLFFEYRASHSFSGVLENQARLDGGTKEEEMDGYGLDWNGMEDSGICI